MADTNNCPACENGTGAYCEKCAEEIKARVEDMTRGKKVV